MKFVIVNLAVCSLVGVQAYNVPNNPEVSRRNMLGTAAGAAALLLGNREALADDDVMTPLYFGVGVRSNGCVDGRVEVDAFLDLSLTALFSFGIIYLAS
jgi:Tfp pilus assembly protein PilV